MAIKFSVPLYLQIETFQKLVCYVDNYLQICVNTFVLKI